MQRPVTIKMSEEQIEVINFYAKRNLMSLSSYVRKAVLHYLMKNDKVKKKDIEKFLKW